MKDMMGNGFIANADAFSVATQIYVRMRRVTGRVIDAMYVVQNKDYAKYVITLALETEDDELKRCVERLKSLVETIPELSQKKKLLLLKSMKSRKLPLRIFIGHKFRTITLVH